MIDPSTFLPASDAVRALVALLRRSGELAEPAARPGSLEWEPAVTDPTQAIAMRVRLASSPFPSAAGA